jgi:hypothetical protein
LDDKGVILPVRSIENLRDFDNKCVRITDTSGDVYEGIASYFDREYVFHEYGCNQEALCLTPIMFYKNDISSVINLEDTTGPFGHYSEKYGLLERTCLDGGTDLIGEIFDLDDDDSILRMLLCINDSFQSLTGRAVPEPIYLGELENMLDTLVKYNKDDRVVNEAKNLLERFLELED